MSPETVWFFRQPAIVRLLDHARRCRYAAGSTLIHRDSPGDRLYLIIRGSVSVIQDDEDGRELVMDYLNPGDFIGEMGLFAEDRNPQRLDPDPDTLRAGRDPVFTL